MKTIILLLISIFIISCNTNNKKLWFENKPITLTHEDSLWNYKHQHKLDSIKNINRKNLLKFYGGYSVENFHLTELEKKMLNSAELYVLKKNGNAIWMWIVKVNNKFIQEKRYGKWTTNGKDKIVINIKNIEETFIKKNGVFVDNLTWDRYLKKIIN